MKISTGKDKLDEEKDYIKWSWFEEKDEYNQFSNDICLTIKNYNSKNVNLKIEIESDNHHFVRQVKFKKRFKKINIPLNSFDINEREIILTITISTTCYPQTYFFRYDF